MTSAHISTTSKNGLKLPVGQLKASRLSVRPVALMFSGDHLPSVVRFHLTWLLFNLIKCAHYCQVHPLFVLLIYYYFEQQSNAVPTNATVTQSAGAQPPAPPLTPQRVATSPTQRAVSVCQASS